MKRIFSIGSRASFIIIFFLIVVGVGMLVYVSWPFLSLIRDPEAARAFIIESGSWGPILFILMQIAQVFLAPIPGQVIGLLGGYLFGPLLGIVYMMIGALIGFTLIFIFSRKFGRPFVTFFVSEKMMDKFDRYTKEKGAMIFFLIFLLPGFPDDVISFIAGLTTIPIRTLVVISVVGRLPGYVALNLTGNGLTSDDLNPIVVVGVAFVFLSLIVWWKRAWLHRFVEHEHRLTFLKETWRVYWHYIMFGIAGFFLLVLLIYKLVNNVSLPF